MKKLALMCASAVGAVAAPAEAAVLFRGSQQIGGVRADYSFVTDGREGVVRDSEGVLSACATLTDGKQIVTLSSDAGDRFAFGGFIQGPTLVDLNVFYLISRTTSNELYIASLSSEVRAIATIDDGTGGQSSYASFDLGTVFATAVPEPATWAMMLIGFGLVGAGLRARRRITVTYA